jgi:hypothetical protein
VVIRLILETGDKQVQAKNVNPKVAKVLYTIVAVLFLFFAGIFALASLWIGFAIFFVVGGLFVVGAIWMGRK